VFICFCWAESASRYIQRFCTNPILLSVAPRWMAEMGGELTFAALQNLKPTVRDQTSTESK